MSKTHAFSASLGDESDVITGVDVAITKMKKGEISLVNCDSSYAFGEKGRPEWGIGPSVTVEYEIHLKSFVQVTLHISGFPYKILVE